MRAAQQQHIFRNFLLSEILLMDDSMNVGMSPQDEGVPRRISQEGVSKGTTLLLLPCSSSHDDLKEAWREAIALAQNFRNAHWSISDLLTRHRAIYVLASMLNALLCVDIPTNSALKSGPKSESIFSTTFT